MNYLSAAGYHKLEHPFLKEWIKYHLCVGVEHFYMGCNDDNDSEALTILQPYVNRNIVTHFHMPGRVRQFDFYSKAVEIARKSSKWLAIIDLDEFILPINKSTIPDVLKNYEDFGGLAINWRHFGTKLETNPRSQINELLYHNIPDGHIKSIIQPNKATCNFNNTHGPIYEEGYYAVNEKFQRVDGPLCNPPTCDEIVINHYFCRSKEFWEVKQQRQRSDHAGIGWYEDHIFNGINEQSIIFDDLISRKYKAINKKLPIKVI